MDICSLLGHLFLAVMDIYSFFEYLFLACYYRLMQAKVVYIDGKDWESSDEYYYELNPFKCQCHHCGINVPFPRQHKTGPGGRRCRCICSCEMCPSCRRCKKTRRCGNPLHEFESEESKRKKALQMGIENAERDIDAKEQSLLEKKQNLARLKQRLNGDEV